MAARKSFLGETMSEFSEDRCASMAAALAYYTVFSLPPLLVILLAIARQVFGQQAAEGRLFGELAGLVGSDVALQLQDALHRQDPQGGRSLVAGAIGIGVLLLGATGVFGQLQTSLNNAWDVAPDPARKGIGAVVRVAVRRLLSFSMLVVIGFLLLVSLALGAAVSAFGDEIASALGVLGKPALTGIQLGVSLVVATALFAAMFKVLPDARIAWRDVLLGALVTAVLFVLGKWGIGVYVAHAKIGSAYGAAGTLVVLLVWIYYASMILFVGAEITQVLARRSGRRIEPSEGAVRLIREVRRDDTGSHPTT